MLHTSEHELSVQLFVFPWLVCPVFERRGVSSGCSASIWSTGTCCRRAAITGLTAPDDDNPWLKHTEGMQKGLVRPLTAIWLPRQSSPTFVGYQPRLCASGAMKPGFIRPHLGGVVHNVAVPAARAKKKSPQHPAWRGTLSAQCSAPCRVLGAFALAPMRLSPGSR